MPSDTTPTKKPSLLIPIVVACSFFMEQLDSTIITTAIPAMAKSLGTEPVRLSLAITSYILSLAVFIPISGWFADRFGSRRVFCAAIIVFTTGSALSGFAPSLPFLVVTRVLQGMGGAMLSPVGRLILLRSFPKEDLARAMAYVAIPALIGPTVGPVLGGFITTYFNWRWIFYVNIPVGLIGITLALRYTEDFRATTPSRFDLRGFVILGVGLATLQFGFENVGRHVLPPADIAASFAAAGVALGLFGWHVNGHPNPVLDLGLFHIRTFRIGTLAGGICRTGMNSVPFMLPLLFQLGFGLSPLHSGLLTFASAIGSITVRPMSSTLLRWLGFRRLLFANAIVVTFIMAGFTLLGPSTPHWVILGYILVFGVVRTTQFNTSNMLAYSEIPPARLSRSTSLGSAMQQLTLGFGVSISAALLDTVMPREGVPTLHDFHIVFLVMALIPLLASPGFLPLAETDGVEVSRHRVRDVQPAR
ncbi:MAG TPA: DHA2 family efflux MFS transporter permease subunit [Acetobacteraceae bacterium]|nr:DHA2 family efflux MFS transporter permease subunit [Acetobacteraceae bacterium]